MASLDDVRSLVQKHWGFDSFRPLQEQAIRCVLERRDSLVVLPTGGGKSLCYQAPALAIGGATVVVSPLISLMKDQVDSLKACGVPAVQFDSSLSSMEREVHKFDILQGNVRLIFVSPERIVFEGFRDMLRRAEVKTFAIDEAHCISHWGHDFRPEYRQIGELRRLFPDASFHGYTATATEQVRADICKQLGLQNPAVLVGNFDRPNLSYRILPRTDPAKQILDVLDRHKKEAGIIYTLRRAEVDDYAEWLQKKGFRCVAYHAGLTADERRAAQDAFAAEKVDVVVATVAFGMGIDRSNIRFVLHANMPKSVEHYQQETGRAGRDGLEADCVLLYSAGDTMTWKKILQKSAEENQVDPDFLPNALKHLDDMDRYCRSAQCRHRALVNYFGQDYDRSNCGACDQCLGDTEVVPDSLVLAQKILSCVARTGERFGVGHVVSVLRGENTERIRSLGHDRLTTFGLCRDYAKNELRDWIYQLVGQEVLVQTTDEYPILKLNDGSWQVFRKERTVRLVQPLAAQEGEAHQSVADVEQWEGVDRGLFEDLRELRKDLATQRSVPPYVIFSDATLRALAMVRPTTLDKLRYIYGIGDMKLRDFGDQFLARIAAYCQTNNVPTDRPVQPKRVKAERRPGSMSRGKSRAFELFREGCDAEEVMGQLGRAKSTVEGYLAEYIEHENPDAIDRFVSPAIVTQVTEAAEKDGTGYLKPIFVALGEKVPYETIRLVMASVNGRKQRGG